MNYRRDQEAFLWLQRFVDFLLPIVSLYLYAILSGQVLDQVWFTLALVVGAVFLFVAQLFGVFRNWLDRSFWVTFNRCVQSGLVSVAIVAGFWGLLAPELSISLVFLAGWGLMFFALLLGYRAVIVLLLWHYRAHHRPAKRVLICGAGTQGRQLAEHFLSSPWLGYEVVGFLDDKHPSNSENKILGSLDLVNDGEVLAGCDEVFICLPLRAERKIKAILNSLADSTKVVRLVPDLFSFDLIHSDYSDFRGMPVFNVFDSPLRSLTARGVKRVFDLVFSLLVLLVSWPLWLLIALAIKLDSTGPVLFKQLRYGLDGKEIRVYKFRSMSVLEDGNVVTQACRGDRRVTRVGAVLRKLSMDELPQFINVLQGRMSVVGPRPHAKSHNETYRKLVPKYMQRHLVKPGITGWAQVNGWRGETDTLNKMEKRVEFDLHYIKNWSLWLDVKIVFLTLFTFFNTKDVY